MNKKRNIIIIIFLLVVISILLILYIYNHSNNKEESEITDFVYNELKNKKKDIKYSDSLDKDTYKDKIITDDLLIINYNFFDNKESITGSIYIGEDKGLYITDKNLNKVHKISSSKFRTLYVKDYEYLDGIYVYAISYKNDLYSIELTENNISKTNINKVNLPYKVTNFVNIDFKNDIHKIGKTLLVLLEDGNIYDVTSNMRYTLEIKSLYNTMYTFADNTFTDVYGNIFSDEENKPYKIKYVFLNEEDNDFLKKNTIMIITQDNRFLYVEKDPEYAYEFTKRVVNLEFDMKYPYVADKLKIRFADNSVVEFNVSCNEYYCINKFIE